MGKSRIRELSCLIITPLAAGFASAADCKPRVAIILMHPPPELESLTEQPTPAILT